MSETAPRADDHDPERMPGAGDDRGGIWHPRYLWVTVGAVAMIFLAATQALAVTTVMPLVSADLGGDALQHFGSTPVSFGGAWRLGELVFRILF